MKSHRSPMGPPPPNVAPDDAGSLVQRRLRRADQKPTLKKTALLDLTGIDVTTISPVTK